MNTFEQTAQGNLALGHLMTVEEAARCIRTGRSVAIAGDEAALRRLPKGLWIGGTIPYFMTEEGGVCDRNRVFVNEIPLASGEPGLCCYDVNSIDQVCKDAPDNGFSVLILPAFTEIHEKFSRDAPEFDGMYLQPLIGWIAGVHLNDLSTQKPKVVFGPTGEFLDEKGVAMHVAIESERSASIEIVNVFSPGKGPGIHFPDHGFDVRDIEIQGKRINFARYLIDAGIDTRLPLVADCCGAFINVSIQSVDAESGMVRLYAPVFPGIEYRIAGNIPPYAEVFAEIMPGDHGEMAFCCNCVLNYLYGDLEGKNTGSMVGPMTFGEIAYQLVNQTMVYLRIT